MSIVCPKCSYQRAPADVAPDWQCPSCGIAYAKFLKPVARASSGSTTQVRLPVEAHEASPESASMAQKFLGVIAFLAAFAIVRYGLNALRSHSDATETQSEVVQQQENALASKSDVAIVAEALPGAKEPNVPVDVLRDLFDSAHKNGEANGLMVIDSGGKSLSPRFNPTAPVKVRVERKDSLFQYGCNRFKVTLMQGGSVDTLPNGRQAKSAISMLVTYSLNYCVGGQVPDGGRDIQMER